MDSEGGRNTPSLDKRGGKADRPPRDSVPSLRSELRRLEFLSSLSEESISLVNTDYVYADVNQAYCVAHQRTREDTVGRPVTDVWGEEAFRDIIKPFVDRCLAGDTVRYTRWFDFPGLGLRCVDVTYCPYHDDGGGGVSHAVVVSRDVTEREKYRGLFERSRDAIFVVGRDGKFVEANQSALDLLGYTEIEITGLELSALYALSEDEIKVLQGLEQEGFLKDIEVKLRKKNGVVMHCLLTSTIHRGENGSILGYQGIIRDLTERKRLEEHSGLQDRLAALGQLAGGMAHDFNNALMTITLNCEMLLAESGLPADLAPDVESILEEARESAVLVRQVLDFSRGSVFDTQLVDVAALVQKIYGMLQRTLPGTIQVLLEMRPDEYMVEADPTRLQQVLMNLVINARDAMTTGGELRISLSRVVIGLEDETPTAEMSSGEWICLAVIDNGIGIPAEVLPHVFEPFFTTKPRGEGTGLGLAQVFGIVRQHGGDVAVDTEVGRGTAIRVFLPAHAAPEVESVPVQEVSVLPQFRGETILVVEDGVKVRRLCQRLLESLGAQVLTAANGREALDVYREADPVDLVLTDMVMPEMGGRELIQELRKLTPRVRLVVMTGYVLAEEIEQIKAEGPVDVVYKPLDADALAWIIRRALDRA